MKDIHAKFRVLADYLGGTYTPDADGDGGTLYVADYLSGLRRVISTADFKNPREAAVGENANRPPYRTA